MNITAKRIYWYILFKFMSTGAVLKRWMELQGDTTVPPHKRSSNPLTKLFFSEIVRRQQTRPWRER